jgi:tetratricopeptide (TPR) repeat protein
LHQQGLLDDAIESYQNHLQDHASDEYAHFNIAVAYRSSRQLMLNQGDPDGMADDILELVIQHYQTATELDPKNPSVCAVARSNLSRAAR